MFYILCRFEQLIILSFPKSSRTDDDILSLLDACKILQIVSPYSLLSDPNFLYGRMKT